MNKLSLEIYRKWKVDIEEEKVYDNSPSSVTLFKARSNALQLNDRKRYTECKL